MGEMHTMTTTATMKIAEMIIISVFFNLEFIVFKITLFLTMNGKA